MYCSFYLKDRQTLGGGACAGLVVLLFVCALCTTGCREGKRNTPPGLAGRFEVVGPPAAAGDAFMRHLPVTRRGLRKDAMVLVAPLVIRAPLGGHGGPVCFRSLVAPVFNVGDGFHLEIFHARAGEARRVYTRQINAARRYEDRQWLSIEVPVEIKRGPEEYLEIRLSGGPRGDLVGDWLALAEMGFFERAGS